LPGQPILVTFELELAGDRVVPVCGKGLFLEIDALIGRTEDIGLLEGKRGLRLTFGSPLDQTTVTDPVFGLPDTVCRVGLDDAGIDSIGQDSAQETDGPRGSANATTNNRLAAQLLRLDG
jgi:hypothetical protein